MLSLMYLASSHRVLPKLSLYINVRPTLQFNCSVQQLLQLLQI